MSNKHEDFVIEDRSSLHGKAPMSSEKGHELQASAARRALWLYLRGQYFSLVTVVLSLVTGSLIWTLAHWETDTAIDWNNLLYFWLLSALAGTCTLVGGFVRQKHYFISLLRLQKQSSWRPLYRPVTAEQKLATDIMKKLHRNYEEELDHYRRQRELHRHFVYQWVHMMKTPLSVIDLAAQNASHTVVFGREELRGFMDSLREEVDRMARGLEQMLHTARLEEFALDLHPQRVALHEAVRRAINQHKQLMIAADVYPQLSGEGWIETDFKWLQFLLSQLIGNAVKYSQPKPGTKRLRVNISSRDNGYAWIEIIDQGIGIPAQDLPRVFDPFFTGENGRTTEESTGMGLYLCRKVARKLGLRLELRSEQGDGTTVKVYFESATIFEQVIR